MLAKFRILMIALFALVAVPETIFADDTAKISALEELLKQYMDENAELKKVIAEQGANEPEADGDVVVDEANAPAESADATVRLELYSSEVICKRSKLNANEIGLVAKMDAQKFADEAKRRGLDCADKVVDDVNTPSDGADETVRLELYSSEIICERAHLNDKEYGLVVKMDAQKYADEAERRGLDCSQAATQTCKVSPENCDETELCKMATYGSSVKVWYSGSGQVYVDAAQARGLDCGVEKTAYIPTPVKTCEEDPKNCNADELCKKATYGSSVKVWYSGSGQVYVDAAQARGLDCGVGTTDKVEGKNQQVAEEAQAAEQKRLADEKQMKADADAKAAEQKRLADERQKADADAKAAEQKRLADEKQKEDADAKTAEQKRLADEQQKKADADAKAAEQKRLADEKQKKTDADAQAAEQQRLVDEETPAAIGKVEQLLGIQPVQNCDERHEKLAELAGLRFGRADIGKEFWKECFYNGMLFSDGKATLFMDDSSFRGFTYGDYPLMQFGTAVLCFDIDLMIKKRGFGLNCRRDP